MSKTAINRDLLLKPIQSEAPKLFDLPEDWRSYWWGMPAFEMKNAMPQFKIIINFMTAADVKQFAEKTGLLVTKKSNSAWFPYRERLSGEFQWTGPKINSRYPICIPSKGRAHLQTTGKVLDRMGISYKFFVEETEFDQYCAALGENNVIKLPFHDLGKGSIPARNFIWDWAAEREFARHWVVDDNILNFARCHNNRRLRCRSGALFQALEDFADRYDNLAMFGPHHAGFVDDAKKHTPVNWNTRVYSCILIDTKLTERWRGRYNEDTDLSLRMLKAGHVTGVCRALLMKKAPTHGSKRKAMAGGNTDNVYTTNDHRLAFAESLKQQHPDCVEIVWKFNRWHHQVDYSAFRKNKPILRSHVTPVAFDNEYGMELVESRADD